MGKQIIFYLFLSFCNPFQNNAQTAKVLNDKSLDHWFYLGVSAGINYSQINLRRNTGLFSKTISSKIDRGEQSLGWNTAITAEFQVLKKLNFSSGLGLNFIQSSAI